MMRAVRFRTFEPGHTVLSEQGANVMTIQTIPTQNTGGHVRVGILCVAFGAVLGVTGAALAIAIDSDASTGPSAVVVEDSAAARSTGCRTMTADGTERCLAAASIAPPPVVIEDSAATRGTTPTSCRTMTADGTERCLAAASIAPPAVAIEDSAATRGTPATDCRTMTADGTERCLASASIA
jgi:hypothetical protein